MHSVRSATLLCWRKFKQTKYEGQLKHRCQLNMSNPSHHLHLHLDGHRSWRLRQFLHPNVGQPRVPELPLEVGKAAALLDEPRQRPRRLQQQPASCC